MRYSFISIILIIISCNNNSEIDKAKDVIISEKKVSKKLFNIDLSLYKAREQKIKRGDTFGKILEDNKIDYPLVHRILENIKLTSKALYAVNGNNDDYDELNDVEVITTSIGDIVVTHGHKHYPDYHDSLRESYPNALVVIYGHTHHHTLDMTKKPYIINPGAAGKTRTQGGASCIILSNSCDGFTLELKKFNTS